MQSRYQLLTHLRRRGGIYLNRARRSIWVHAREPEAFDAARPLLRWLRTAVPTDRMLLTSTCPRTCTWLTARYPNDNVLPPPWGAKWIVGRFFDQLRPLVIICMGEDNLLGSAVLGRAAQERVPVVLIDAAGPPPPAMVAHIHRYCVRTPAVAAEIAALGVPSARLHVTGALIPAPGLDSAAANQAVQRTIEALGPVVAAIPPPAAATWDRTAPRRMDRLTRTTLGRLIVATRRGRQLNGFDALRARLGYPETILCLGNGPSSEDPRVLEVKYDALFRVNWRWRERGVLTHPDMVFVGDLQTTARLRACVFGFRTVAWESEVLLRHLLFNRNLRRLEYFTYERASTLLNDGVWPAHPTNGTVMIATAVALKPQRLIVAGIDLYLDPRGRYPGDPTPENDFPQMHSRNVEIEILDKVFAQRRDETWIWSEPLREALAARRLGSGYGQHTLGFAGTSRSGRLPVSFV